ncbi:12914_t:CDS:2, partial [Ambispora gerdemannii]
RPTDSGKSGPSDERSTTTVIQTVIGRVDTKLNTGKRYLKSLVDNDDTDSLFRQY